MLRWPKRSVLPAAGSEIAILMVCVLISWVSSGAELCCSASVLALAGKEPPLKNRRSVILHRLLWVGG